MKNGESSAGPYGFVSPEQESGLIALSSLPVAAGVLRFLVLARNSARVAAPETVLFQDRILGASVLLWAVLFGCVVY